MLPVRDPRVVVLTASALGLFLELALVRWVSCEIRVFAYCKNLVLVACFLGFGAGCLLQRRRALWQEALCALLALTLLIRLPWQALAVLLMRKYPNLSYLTGALPPREVPAELIDFANEDGAYQLLFATGAGAAQREQALKQLPELPLARPVWPRFLRENALRIFGL